MGVSAIGVDFSAKQSNKTLLYNNFMLMVENRKIKVVYDYDCHQQLTKLEIKETAAKKLQVVEHKSEGDHDDYPDSLAILIHISVRPSNIPITATFVTNETTTGKDGSNINKREEKINDYLTSQVRKSRSEYYEEKRIFNGGMF